MENFRPTKMEIQEFLDESNKIEGVFDLVSLQQAEEAWKYLMTQKKLTHGVIKKTHKILMLHQPLYPNEKGYYRTIPIYIGGRKIYPEQIEELLDNWIEFMNSKSQTKPKGTEEISQKLHVVYEKIHPFVDGNGRTGRMFMNWFRLKNKLPLLIIHAGKEQISYYKWFA